MSDEQGRHTISCDECAGLGWFIEIQEWGKEVKRPCIHCKGKGYITEK